MSFFKQSITYIFIALLYTTLNPAIAERQALILSDTFLLKQPSASAEQLNLLKEDSLVVLHQRKGGWYKISTDSEKSGWVRMLKVRFISNNEANDRSIAKLLRDTAIMPPAAGISTGVRGVSSGKLEKDEKSGLSLEDMSGFVPTEENLEQFKKDGGLSSEDEVELKLEP